MKKKTNIEEYQKNLWSWEYLTSKETCQVLLKDINDVLKYYDKIRGGMLNRVSVIDYHSSIKKVIKKGCKK